MQQQTQIPPAPPLPAILQEFVASLQKPETKQLVEDIIQSHNVKDANEHTEFASQLQALSSEQREQYTQQFNTTAYKVGHEGAISIAEANKVVDVVRGRINELSASISAAPVIAAPAAGDEDPRNGAWIGGFVGNSTDKKDIKTKTNFGGGSIGYERFVNDTDAVGFALTTIRGNTKYGSSNKTESNSFIASLYGFTNHDGLILSGAVFGGLGNFKSSRQITTAGGDVTAKGKFKSNLYGIQTALAYQVQQDEHLITPSIGLQYSAIKQNKYAENGAGVNNLEIGSKRGSILLGTFATKYGYVIQNEGMIIIPSIQVGVASELSTKSSNVKTKFLWQDQALYNYKANDKRQTRFFATPSITAKSDFFDLNLSYTFDKAKKATGHIVALKVLAKF
jgi:outer membrane autotransporter protein